MNGWRRDANGKGKRNGRNAMTGREAIGQPVAARGTRPYAAEIIRARLFSQYSVERFGRVI